jgi:pantoate--beta-alanine ligase
VEVFRKTNELQAFLASKSAKNREFSVGFVPTMGALHDGHLSLVHNSQIHSDITVVSIFVNPTQFNNPSDLAKYPRREGDDLKLLKDSKCDVVFIPDIPEVYPTGVPDYEMDFGVLNEVMEGKFRPGHFKGVAMVVERLFDMVKPQVAFFGEKDFQQLAVIRKMVALRDLKISIRSLPTVREKNGLAMSSRNQRLSENGKNAAAIIFQTLQMGKNLLAKSNDLPAVKKKMIEHFNSGQLELEYLEISDEITLLPATSKENSRAFIAAICEGVRLIDNMKMESKI